MSMIRMYVKLISYSCLSDAIHSKCFPDEEIFNRQLADVRVLSGSSLVTKQGWGTYHLVMMYS